MWCSTASARTPSTPRSTQLKRRGLIVCVGTSSGPIPPFNPHILGLKGSPYLTRPALADYIADPAEKAALADELFGHVASGRIKIEINQRYALQDAVAGPPRSGVAQDDRLLGLRDLKMAAARTTSCESNN